MVDIRLVNGGKGLVTGYDLFAISAIWPLAALSLLGQTIYGSGLVSIYRYGDLSGYYPVVVAHGCC